MADEQTKRKIDEVLGLTQKRRRRQTPLKDLGIKEEAHDPYMRALYEQPPPEATVATDQDVIVQPGTPGVDEPMATPPPEEAPTEVPDEIEEPEDENEEQKRALFNTLSELIDLGRIERTEVEIRKYSEEHEDELGELLDVLDEVVDMLVVEANIWREPQTFEPESTPGQKGDEGLKPGVGSQVSVGSTVSTVIASDQAEPKGQALKEEVLTLKIVKGTVDEALEVMGKLPVESTNLMRVSEDEIQVVRDARNREDVEKQLNALKQAGVEFEVAEKREEAIDRILAGEDVGEVLKEQGYPTFEVGDAVEVHVPGTKEWSKARITSKMPSGAVVELQSGERTEVKWSGVRQLSEPEDGEEEPEYPESVTEQMDITRAAVAVEVRFGKKEEAQAAKGALLQYKGVDGVEEIADGGLIVFTTDTDVDEARTRVETIMRNARIPLESVVTEGYEPIWMGYNGPDVMPTPMPLARGQSGADLEQEDEDFPVEIAYRLPGKGWKRKIVKGQAELEKFANKVEDDGGEIRYGGKPQEQVEPDLDTDAVPGEEKYLKPFFEPDGGEPGEPSPEEEPSAESVIWRMDVPEDPAEFDRLAEVLNRAKDEGMIVSWTRVTGEEEEMPPEEPEGEVLDLRPEVEADVDVAVPAYEAKIRGNWHVFQMGTGKMVGRSFDSADAAWDSVEGEEGEYFVWQVGSKEKPQKKRMEQSELETGYTDSRELRMEEDDDLPKVNIEAGWGDRLDLVRTKSGKILSMYIRKGSRGTEYWVGDSQIDKKKAEKLAGGRGKLERLIDAAYDKGRATTEQVEPPEMETLPDDAFADEIPPVDEVPPEEEPEKEFIAVEFAPETEPDERLHFPEYLTAETEDPETGEGGVLVGGWEAVGDEEVAEPTDDEFLMPDEEPVPPEGEEDLVGEEGGRRQRPRGTHLRQRRRRPESPEERRRRRRAQRPPEGELPPELIDEAAELTTLTSGGFYFEITTDTEDEAFQLNTAAAYKYNIKVERLRGNILSGMIELESEAAAEKAVRDLASEVGMELREAELDEQDPQYQRYLQTQKELGRGIKHAAGKEPSVRVRPSVWKAAMKKPGAPDLPPDVQALVKDYRAAMTSGDAELAQRIKGELEFELLTLGVDVKTVLGEAKKKKPFAAWHSYGGAKIETEFETAKEMDAFLDKMDSKSGATSGVIRRPE